MAKKKAKKAQATPAQLRKRVDAMTKEAERLAARLAKLTAERDALAAKPAALVAPPPAADPTVVAPEAPQAP